MDVRLPDGTVIQNVPDDMTKVQLAQKLQANGYDVAKLRPEVTAGERATAAGAGVQRGSVAGLLGLPVDTAENLINLGVGGVNRLMGRGGESTPPLQSSFGGSQWIADKLRNMGAAVDNPRPDDPLSRMLYTGGVLAGGSAGMPPAQALASAASGAIAGEFLGPQWVGPASMAPAAAGQAASAAKNAIAAKAAPIVETFKQAGTMPSVGQAMDNVFLHGLENLASKFPGGAGVMQKFIEAQQRSMGDQARTGVPTEAAGRAIESGVKGSGGFLDRTKATWERLDNAVAAKIPQGSSFQPSNTVQALDALTKQVPGAEKTTGALANPKLAEMKANLAADLKANNGVVPFDALRSLRSKVGSMLDESLVTGIPGGELKRVYGALSKDLEAAATQAGAGKEFARQQNFYSARMDRIETVLDRVIGKGKQPEDIFKTFMPSDPDQANKVRAVMRSLAPSERLVVSEAVANRLGRAKPGIQDVEGQIFSSETFLTNWNKLSPGAKAQLFPNPPLRENMDKLANSSSSIRAGKGIYANPSGTAGSFAAYSVYLSPLASVAAGSPAPLVAAGLASGSAFVGAKMMTNPRIVEWLATPVNPQSPQAATHLAKLGVIYNQIDDPQLKRELGQFVGSISGK